MIIYYEAFWLLKEKYFIDNYWIIYDKASINEVSTITNKAVNNFKELRYKRYKWSDIIHAEDMSKILKLRITDFVDYVKRFWINISSTEDLTLYCEEDYNEWYFSISFNINYSKKEVSKKILDFIDNSILTDYSNTILKENILKYFDSLEKKYGKKDEFFRIDLLELEKYFLDKRSIYLFLLKLDNEDYIEFTPTWWDFIRLKKDITDSTIIHHNDFKKFFKQIHTLRKYLEEDILEQSMQADFIREIRQINYEDFIDDEITILKIKKLLDENKTIWTSSRQKYSSWISNIILTWEEILKGYLSENKDWKKTETLIRLWENINYYPQKYLFQNPKNSKEYNIKDHWNYDKMMDVLLKNTWNFVTYNEFIETSWMKLLKKNDTRDPQKRITDSKGLLLNHVSNKLGIEKIEFIKTDNGLKLMIL